MIISERVQGSITILQAQGRLDATSAPEADRRLAAVIDSGARQVVLDLAGVDYVSSAGLRVFLAAAKRMQQAQGTLVLASLSPQVRPIFAMAGFSAVLTVCETVTGAIALCSAAASPAAPAQAAAPVAHGLLSFAEEIYLLALDDKAGLIKPLPTSALDYALAGALLMELALLGRIDTDLATLKVTSAAATGNPLLDDILGELQQKPEPQATSFWLKQLAAQAEQIEQRVLASLVKKGILKQENRRILWVFAVRRYPLIDNREIKEVRTRLRELILGEAIPDPRDVVLISLGGACRLLDDLLTPEEAVRAQTRIATLVRLDLIGREMAKAIREIERSMASSMAMMPGGPFSPAMPFAGMTGGAGGMGVY